ncbi:MAG: hypothetical protein A3C22_00215 [Candidatus Levybacteria bacterium RIFCSPHIGHO2_02_FULL_37_10]|uniref:Uncharacterized protein n=1 Tax=Candidatus Portnoybacteria bacterium RIFCSPHIGHO2_01_FULL_40_12b TaxID=1801994 RepID=A0A1G2FBP4_9BACT|nr:MAG: hypothetical protein A3C22_00215 [Candidatus Levybacteria bacterium RIFCSPHIGHO2_02_FULL_37_10]OGH42591.1 MAG: hypothetical protein A3H79_02480 [Candidatus Levybacteria bacterium RIFCSPLOWO2_02_FULL_36_8b]OGZ34981.1 MAG: hypothetical protein A2815_01075 [Candidatus Portnoybacteria bacterium RIFCSPHIGHO2_01_FULL_40_12b]
MKEKADYQLLRYGGRVKSAGFPVDFVFEQGKSFRADPGPDSAAQTTKVFAVLRDNPPSEIRNRFFPLDRGGVKAQTKGSPALYRPVLKNDQGAGKFLPFTIGEGALAFGFPSKVAMEEGYVIPEAYFQDQLRYKGSQPAVEKELSAVKDYFRVGSMDEGRLAFERLEIECDKAGIVFRRKAQVGRNGLMFIHPAMAEKQIILPVELVVKVEERISDSLARVVEVADFRKKEFALNNNLSYRPLEAENMPTYFQADVHILPNGDFAIAELQFPDVGLFLNGLPIDGSHALRQIHAIVGPMKDKVIDGFEKIIKETIDLKGKVPLYLVTRSEVIENKEDVLEIRELAEVQAELKSRGYETQIISAASASNINCDSLMFLFNLDPTSAEFHQLARAYLMDTERKLCMIPDPFLRVAEREFTDYDHIAMTTKQSQNLQAIVREIESFNDKKDKLYTQMLALDYFLRQMGINEDVLHFCHPALPTPIPAYRYDIKSLQLAANIIKEGNLKDVNVRAIPISPDRAVLLDKDGGTLYATFRFMFVRR